MKLSPHLLALLTSSAVTLLAGGALADPSERVGRISYIEGEVSFQPPETDIWTEATRNFPVAPGESFWTGDSGRAELQIGGVAARLDSQTDLEIVDLSYGGMRLALSQGSVNLELRNSPRGGVTISTPAGDVRIDGQGDYRIDVGAPQDDGSYAPVELTVLRGQAEAPGPGGALPIYEGQAAVIYAGYDPQVQEAEETAIDGWTHERDDAQRWRPRQDISVSMTGVEDLDAYGDYNQTAAYGAVWFPRDIPSDWAPYRYGHWAYVAPWGYTWIDQQPWGFAPFHYGRWAQFDGRWGWIPGRSAPEPVYAPALVAFIGGAGWNLSVNLGGGDAVGWVPLAPEEVYRPPYEVSDAYVRNVNITNVRNTTIINNTTVNTVTVNNYRNAPAATVVRASALSSGASVHTAVVPVSAEALARAPSVRPATAAPPRPEAKTGVVHAAGAAPVFRATPPPPARLQAVRAAVIAQPPGQTKPPAIQGARIAPPPPPPPPRAPASPGGPPAPAHALIAPAQMRNPAAQVRPPLPPRPGTASRPPGLTPRPLAPSTAPRPAPVVGDTQAPPMTAPPPARRPRLVPPPPPAVVADTQAPPMTAPPPARRPRLAPPPPPAPVARPAPMTRAAPIRPLTPMPPPPPRPPLAPPLARPMVRAAPPAPPPPAIRPLTASEVAARAKAKADAEARRRAAEASPANPNP